MNVQSELINHFLNHVNSSPNTAAILTSQSSLTYQELYTEVLAQKALLSQYPCTKAVVCLKRSPRLIAVLLALQWLDITYIPVDLDLPLERLQTIIEDSGCELFLHDDETASKYTGLSCLQINLAIENKPKPCEEKPRTHNPIAYIIYTSGSTGKPKGVAISHRALSNFLNSMSGYFLNDEEELLLAITTIAFDISGLELFLPLWKKKTILLANQEQFKDPLSLMHLLKKFPVTLLQATPSMWKLLLTMDWAYTSKLVALTGGEPLTQSLANDLLARVKSLWNMYGPTEATIWCSLKQIKKDEPITIGYPIANTQMSVLDESFNPLPPFVKGELYISGLCLAEGYINNEALTKERFREINGKLLYRVGDIACMTSQGEFIIFGRTDNQIKLHGYRIELEDIEAQIQSLPGIRQAAVRVFQEQLVAYVSVNSPDLFSEEAFYQGLRAKLSEYMIPNRLVILDTLPLSAAGKIDRKALPTPVSLNAQDVPEEGKLTPIQKKLLDIWAAAFGLPAIGLQDNFFDLGGHSLIAGRIVVAIYQQMAREITPKQLYQAPRVAQLAEVVANTLESKPLDYNKSKKTIVDDQWVALNDFQLMLWIAGLANPIVNRLNNVARLRLQGLLNKKALDLALNLVLQKQEMLAFRLSAFYPRQKKQTSHSLQWIETSLTNLNTNEAEIYLAKAFDDLFYYKWPRNQLLLRANLFYLKENQIELQIGISHFISDEDSLSIFLEELSNAYEYYLNIGFLQAKEASNLFVKEVLQQKEQTTKAFKKDSLFWENYLKEADYLNFSQHVILKKTANNTYTTYQEIPEILLERLSQFCSQNRVTLSDALCAAIGLSLKRLAKSPNVLAMTLLKSGRDNPLYDKVIGCFLKLDTLKLDLRANNSLLQLAKQIQSSSLETMEYQRAPYFIKLASIGRKSFWQKFCIGSISAIVSMFGALFHFSPAIATACLALGLTRPKQGFLININMLANFFSKEPQKLNLFNTQTKPIPVHPLMIPMFENVFDVNFHRNGPENRPYVAITSNLRPEFRVLFGSALLKALEEGVRENSSLRDNFSKDRAGEETIIA